MKLTDHFLGGLKKLQLQDMQKQVKVHIFWEGHKIGIKFPQSFDVTLIVKKVLQEHLWPTLRF